MKVIIRKTSGGDEYNISRTHILPFTLGDIVKILDYGSMYAYQEKTFKESSLNHQIPFNLDKEISSKNYCICNEKYHNLEWKIREIGHPITNGYLKRDVILRLVNRQGGEILYSFCEGDETIFVVRKNKKQIDSLEIKI